MASYDIRPLQLRMLKVLLVFDKVCKQQGLRYCIMNGTMIGAIRHKGFIPWDDDMDVGMPRPDYEKFITNCAKWLPQPYEFVCGENDPRCPPSEAIAAHQALLELGKDAELLIYPDEGHAFLKIENVIDHELRRVEFLKRVIERI